MVIIISSLKSKIFIPGNVPSLKNSKIATKKGVFPSKTVVKYLRSLGIKHYSLRDKTVKGYVNRPNLFQPCADIIKENIAQDYPVNFGFHFIRDSKRKFDFHNAVHIIADLLVIHGVISDDDMDHFIPYCHKNENGNYYSIDKESPGVWIYF